VSTRSVRSFGATARGIFMKLVILLGWGFGIIAAIIFKSDLPA
jgi:hypothetical protein